MWEQSVAESGLAFEPGRYDLVGLPTCAAQRPVSETTVPTVRAWEGHEIEAIIDAYFSDHPTVTTEEAKAIFWCESRFEPNAKNPNSTAAGVAQFLRGTWIRDARHFGFPEDPDYRYDPETAIALAALVMARDGGPRQWACAGFRN